MLRFLQKMMRNWINQSIYSSPFWTTIVYDSEFERSINIVAIQAIENHPSRFVIFKILNAR